MNISTHAHKYARTNTNLRHRSENTHKSCLSALLSAMGLKNYLHSALSGQSIDKAGLTAWLRLLQGKGRDSASQIRTWQALAWEQYWNGNRSQWFCAKEWCPSGLEIHWQHCVLTVSTYALQAAWNKQKVACTQRICMHLLHAGFLGVKSAQQYSNYREGFRLSPTLCQPNGHDETVDTMDSHNIASRTTL